MRREGINISPEIVNIKITEYYQKIGKEVIKKTRKSKKKETPNEKKDDLSNIQIVQEELERKKEEKKTENPTQTAFVRVGRPEEHYDNDVKYILMNGMTVNDFIAETGEPEERERIKRVLKKLIFLAWHSEENNRTMDT